MALKTITLAGVQSLEDKAKEVANQLSKIRQEMQENKETEFKLEKKIATDNLNYLEEWAPGAYAQWRKEFTRLKRERAAEAVADKGPKKKN